MTIVLTILLIYTIIGIGVLKLVVSLETTGWNGRDAIFSIFIWPLLLIIIVNQSEFIENTGNKILKLINYKEK